MKKIRHDPLRIHVKTVRHDELASRRFNNFSPGYTTVENPKVLERLERLERLEKLQGLATVSAFVALLSRVDSF